MARPIRRDALKATSEKELLKQLQQLHPKAFAMTAGDKVALKVVTFVPCDIDFLEKLTIPSAKQRRMQYVRTVLDHKPNTDSVKVEKLDAIDGLPDCVVSTGTAIKIDTDLWTLIIDGNGVVLTFNISTQDLAEGDGYNVLAESISLEATEKQKRQQRESENRRRKLEVQRCEHKAMEVAKQRRDDMLRKEYDNLVRIFTSRRSYEFSEFS